MDDDPDEFGPLVPVPWYPPGQAAAQNPFGSPAGDPFGGNYETHDYDFVGPTFAPGWQWPDNNPADYAPPGFNQHERLRELGPMRYQDVRGTPFGWLNRHGVAVDQHTARPLDAPPWLGEYSRNLLIGQGGSPYGHIWNNPAHPHVNMNEAHAIQPPRLWSDIIKTRIYGFPKDVERRVAIEWDRFKEERNYQRMRYRQMTTMQAVGEYVSNLAYYAPLFGVTAWWATRGFLRMGDDVLNGINDAVYKIHEWNRAPIQTKGEAFEKGPVEKLVGKSVDIGELTSDYIDIRYQYGRAPYKAAARDLTGPGGPKNFIMKESQAYSDWSPWDRSIDHRGKRSANLAYKNAYAFYTITRGENQYTQQSLRRPEYEFSTAPTAQPTPEPSGLG